jgi:Ca2+-binding RTX toxin-like protein
VFRDRTTGELYLANRGTDPTFGDIVEADGDLAGISGVARRQAAAMVNWWLDISQPVDTVVPRVRGDLVTYFERDGDAFASGNLEVALSAAGGRIRVVGHSLGGHLTAIFASLFSDQVAHASTFNGAGLFSIGTTAPLNLVNWLQTAIFGDALTRLALAIGASVRLPDAAKLDNFYAMNGLSVTTSATIFNQLGARIPVFNEEDFTPKLGNHYLYKQVDALALFSALAKLDPAVDLQTLNGIAERSSPDDVRVTHESSLERMLDAARRVLLGAGISPTPPSDNGGDWKANVMPEARIQYHQNLRDLQDDVRFKAVAGKLTLVPLTSNSDLSNAAKTDFGDFLTLKLLSPFSLRPKAGVADAAAVLDGVWRDVHGADHIAWNADKAARLAGDPYKDFDFTDAWYADRSELLRAVLRRNEVDTAGGLVRLAGVPSDVAKVFSFFVDGTETSLIAESPTRLGALREQWVKFADDTGRTLVGSGNALGDRLYGGLGADTLDGGDGEDYLEGRGGTDELRGGEKADTLLGGAGSDWLRGGTGRDTLIGGPDSDLLEGGPDVDTYVINTGDGADTIRDVGPGFIRWNKQLLAGAFEKGADGVYRFLSSDPGLRNLTLTFSSPATIADGAGTALTLFDYDSPDDFDTEDFGFALIDEWKPYPTVRRLVGTDGDDYLEGGSYSNEEILGGAGSDRLVGLGGDDYLDGGAHSDHLLGDNDGLPGRDTLVGGPGSDILLGETGSDRLYADRELSLVEALAESGGMGIDARGDWLSGGGGDDLMIGGSANDVLFGGIGTDTLIGGSGNDYLIGDADGAPRYDEGFEWTSHGYGESHEPSVTVSGDDSFHGGGGNDSIHAGYGDDDVFGDDGDDYLVGYFGRDVLVGGRGADVLWAGPRGDLFSDRSEDYLDGGDGDDQLYGSGGRNILIGGAGNDSISTGTDADFVDAGDGDDQISGRGSDTVFAGAGDDVYLAYFEAGVIAYGEAGHDSLSGSEGADQLFGGDGDDWVFGGKNADRLDGGSGDDRYPVRAGDGVDQIVDADGWDVIQLYSYEHTGGAERRIDRSSVRLVAEAGQINLAYGSLGDRIGLGADPRGVVESIELWHIVFTTKSIEVIEFDELWAAYSPTPAPANSAPDFAGALADAVASEDERLVLALPADAFVDADGDPLTFGASLAGGGALPAWLSFDPITGTFSGTPANADVGAYMIEVAASDPEGASATANFRITVANVNDAPVVVGTIGAQTVAEDSLLGFVVPTGLFADPDAGDALTLSAALVGGGALPAWLAFDAALGSFSGTPSNDDVGTISLVLTASDDAGATASAPFLLAVTNTNDAPVVTGTIASQSVEEETFFDFALPPGLFADVDVGDALSLSASLASGDPLPMWLAFDPIAARLAGTPARADLGDWAIRLVATDAVGAETSLTFGLAVAKAPGRVLVGSAGSDTVLGGPGDDVIHGGPGADALIGGKGDDTFVLAPDDGTWSAWYAAYNAGSPGNPGTGRIVGILGRTRLFDTMDGGEGVDTVEGTAGADAVFLDDFLSAFPATAGPRLAGIERFRMGAGNDVVDLTSFDFAYGLVRLDGEDGDDLVWSSSGDDALFGGAGSDDLYGGAGDDALFGGEGHDRVDAAAGVDVAQGGEGEDTLVHTAGTALLDGGAGNDTVIGDAGTEIVASGAGDDLLSPGTGNNLVLHNRGEGIDLLFPAIGARNGLSLGGGIGYEDLALSRSGNDLLLHTGPTDGVTFVDWYGAETNRTLQTLQVIAAAIAGFDTSSPDPIRNDAVEWFDFRKVVEAFDAAHAADATIARWQMIDAFVAADLGGSDDLALGGAIAYRYGTSGSFAGVDATMAQASLRAGDAALDRTLIAIPLDCPLGGIKLT